MSTHNRPLLSPRGNMSEHAFLNAVSIFDRNLPNNLRLVIAGQSNPKFSHAKLTENLFTKKYISIKICVEQFKASVCRSNLRIFSHTIFNYRTWNKMFLGFLFGILTFRIRPENGIFCNFSLHKILTSTNCVGYRHLTES